MSWNNCRKCVLVQPSTYSSSLFKVLLTLKILHGSRTGSKGATFEDIAMHMIKNFNLDGDIKSQVLASLKYGVKMHFIRKKNDKFSLILPASSVYLAPCKCKDEETERIQCIFPPKWYSNVCNDICSGNAEGSCCGKAQRSQPNVCCNQDEQEDEEENPCALCKKKNKHPPPPQNSCNVCANKRKRPPCPPPPCPKRPRSPCFRPRSAPPPCPEPESSSSEDCCTPKKSSPCADSCPQIRQPVCASRKSKRGGRPKSPYDDYCNMCPKEEDDEDDDEDCPPSPCSEEEDDEDEDCPPSPCSESESSSSEDCSSYCPPPKKSKPCQDSCPPIRPSVCASRKGKRGGRSKSAYDDYCLMCPQDDDDDDCEFKQAFKIGANKNCSCCNK